MMKQRFLSSIEVLQLLILSSSWIVTLNAFTPTPSHSHTHLANGIGNVGMRWGRSDDKVGVGYQKRSNIIQLNLAASSFPEASTMRAGELRKELQSYGISTKSFFEKSELVDAVKKARAEGKTPSGESGESKSSKSSSTKDEKSSDSSGSRDEKLAKEMETCKKMKVGELKKELESYGVSTKSFFEKSEFVRAVAEARVDGVKSRRAGGGNRTAAREEEYDPSYRDVQMQKMDTRALGISPVIDVRLG